MLPVTKFQDCLPCEWHVNFDKEYELEEISKFSLLYGELDKKVDGDFKRETKKIVKIKNPFLYMQYYLHKEMYIKNGGKVLELFHDTAESKVESIAANNLDYRRVCRYKFGKGVSFSPCPSYANMNSSRENGIHRAMIIADVLVHNHEDGYYGCIMPNIGCDTTTGRNKNVYVKYFDNEFYPKYAVYYTNN